MRIVALEPLGISAAEFQELAKPLVAAGHEVVAFADRVEDNAVLMERAKDADVLLLTSLPLAGEVIRSVPNLQLISVAFTGVDHIDMATCRELGIIVCNSSGYATHAVAELAFGFMIAVMRFMLPCDAATRAGKTRAGLIGNELFGKTLGIVGTGKIGLRVAELGQAFGCRLLVCDPVEREEAKQLGAKYVSLDELMAESDVVTVHAPLTDETKGLINAGKIALMKPTSVLVNCARGPIVDSEALAAALNDGKIAGAGIDVFEMEPPIPADHPLLNAKNVVVAPHVAFATEEAIFKRAKIVFDNITAWLAGNPQNVM
ncbi:MAG TPA: hydroxyacid dehydrogenase [Firmicutes bacterium]|jgi:D-3-phosphoglycerate dehydrogenase|nr:hydroxyacid dehydrogenase [Bacillota bacterium]